MSSEIFKNIGKNPLGTIASIILVFLLIFFLQSSVGPFATNATILAQWGKFWDNSNWVLKIIWPLLFSMLVIGFVSDEKRVQRLRPLVIKRAKGTGFSLVERVRRRRIEEEEDEDTE